ncbi:type IV secretory system conjugative DNA transfer family protein [Kitasatospora sp. NPDC059973]|uniref:type IV secretory system conjugative DNA transfer family protein n=1 Tax=Kitasatospora sp. NPDC059973 TaxID=3347020 RepID=UPI0036C789A8
MKLPGFLNHLPGGAGGAGGGLAVGALVVLAFFAQQAKTAAEKEALNRAIERFFGNVAAGVGRYFSGRELDGVQRSEATWWHSGAPAPDDERNETPLADLGRRAAPAPGVVLTKAPQPGLLTRAGRAVAFPFRLLGNSLAGMVRVLRAWSRWPLSARSAVRIAPLLIGWGWWRFPGETQLALTAAAGALLVAAATSPAGLGWWRVTPAWTDGQVYGPGLWVPIRQVLRLEDTERRKRWLEVPDDFRADDARILLRLPVSWVGSPEARAQIERLVEERTPGEWIPRWERTEKEHYVEWTLKPKPKPRVKLPDYVQWKPTGDPRKVFIGLSIEDNELVDAIIQTQTETPHWGVGGDTGAGKSTILYLAVVNARMNGELVDILDTKRNSMIEAEGHSGVRVHKTVRACMAAFAEFLTSMMAAEAAGEKGGDPAMRQQLVGRTLVVDELPTLIKLAYIWWRHGIKGKGQPPFQDWLAIILLQGRSSNHRVVVGTQQFANAYFGGTMERAQIGTRIVVGQQERTSWGVAFGQSTPVIAFDTTVKGRGAFSDKRRDAEGEHLFVREIQASFITPEVGRYLAACPQAPDWFDAGAMAPWITEEALKEAASTAAVADFLPGGKYGPASLPPVAVRTTGVIAGSSPTSQGVAAPIATVDATGIATAPPADATPEEDPDAGPETYTLTQAYEREPKILPWKAATVRTYRTRGEKRGIPFPEGVTDGHTWFYTEEELTTWLAAWEDWQKNNNAKPVNSPRPAADDSAKEETPSA